MGAKGPAAGQTKAAKMASAMSGFKGKKKKWPKEKVKEKAANAVLFDEEVYMLSSTRRCRSLSLSPPQ
jgi:ribosomal protein S25